MAGVQAARSRARGSWSLFPSRVRERRPLGELTGVPFTPLCFVRCTPVRSPPRSPATPDAGPLVARCDRAGSTRAPVVRLRLPWCHAGRGDAGTQGWGGLLRAATAPGDLSQRPPMLRALVPYLHPSSPVNPPRSPQRRPRRITRGTCGGIFDAVGREAGSSLRLLFTQFIPHPFPTPSREGRGRAHPPPARGRERGSPSRRISLKELMTGSGWSF